MIILLLINTIAIIILYFKVGIFKIIIRKDETFWNKTLLGYDIWINKFYIRIPIRNKKKIELKEEIVQLKSYSKQHKLQNLSAKFSWLKTLKQVKEFEKKYKEVDETIINDLINKFNKKINNEK